MKKILIVHSNMELGGAETSLLGLLQSVDYSQYEVDLLLLEQKGALLSLIPEEVHLLKTPNAYRHLVLPIKQVIKEKGYKIAMARICGKIAARKCIPKGYAIKLYGYCWAMNFLPLLEKEYDLAISFIDPHYIIQKKVKAKVKLGWLHFDFSNLKINKKIDISMWDGCDYIVHISDSGKMIFDDTYPQLAQKSIVIENILSPQYIKLQANRFDVDNDMPDDGSIKLLSIGRFVRAKNFDNIPFICKYIRDYGIDIKWYIIGYGNEELLVEQKIREAGVQDSVIVLGKKTNPYPYIKACDVYIQPSRWEGKCVAVREAQILQKPVIITNYSTAKSQLKDGVDGIIVPLDNEECAKSIVEVLKNHQLQSQLRQNVSRGEYTNIHEIKKIYQMM